MKESGKLNKESLHPCPNNHRRHGKGKRKHLLEKKNAMAMFENKKAVARFAAFLITGSALDVFGVAVPSVFAYTISATIISDVVYLSYNPPVLHPNSHTDYCVPKTSSEKAVSPILQQVPQGQ